jgi:competence protein ComEA
MAKQFLSGYFNFTKKERMGTFFILLLILIFLFLPFLFPYFITEKKYDRSQFEKEIAALKIKQPDSGINRPGNFDESNYQNYYQPSDKSYYTKQPKGELFYFDPNTLPAEGWRQLGIRDKTANTIRNYITKGGRFYKPEDIAKIWGLHEDEVARLLPYVRIEQKASDAYQAPVSKQTDAATTNPRYSKTVIDINTADTATLISLPGIGSKLANRIIAFRDKLGGFYKTEQVAETYALPDSTFQKIKDRLTIAHATVRQININTATVDELKNHPYIRYNIANAIVQYRQQHGAFSSVSDLKNILIITTDALQKMEPYLFVR